MEANFLNKYYLFTDTYQIRFFINQEVLYNTFNIREETITEAADLQTFSEKLSKDLNEVINLAEQGQKWDLISVKRHINSIYHNYVTTHNQIVLQNTRTELDPMAISNIIHNQVSGMQFGFGPAPAIRDISNIDVINAADHLLQVVSIFIT